MKHKFVKYFLRVLSIVAAAVVLLLLLFYLPPVQRLVIRKAESYVAKHTEMRLSVERFRLSFPLTLSIDRALLTRTQAEDTVAALRALNVQVAFWPLLKKKVEVRRFRLSGAVVHYVDSTALGLHARIGDFSLIADGVDLKYKTAKLRDIMLDDAVVRLELGFSAEDTTSNAKPFDWKIEAASVRLTDIGFGMTTDPRTMALDVTLPAGMVDGVGIDLGKRNVQVERILLTEGNYTFLTGTTRNEGQVVVSDSLPTVPWTIRAGTVELDNNAARYAQFGVRPSVGFDPKNISVTGLNLVLDSAYYRGPIIAGTLENLSFRERSGLVVQKFAARIAVDSTEIALRDMVLRMPGSSVTADIAAGAGVLERRPDAPVRAKVNALVAINDLTPFFPESKDEILSALSGRELRVYTGIDGTLGVLKTSLKAELPGSVLLMLNGTAEGITDLQTLHADASVTGTFSNLSLLKAFVSDTALRRRLGFPNEILLDGQLKVDAGNYRPDIRMEADGGTLSVAGNYDAKQKTYDARIGFHLFPLGEFLPADPLGLLTMQLDASGSGFDVFDPATFMRAALDIAHADYKGHTYRDISLAATLAAQRVDGKFLSRDSVLQADLTLNGLLTRERQEVAIRGMIDTLRTDLMHLTPPGTGGQVHLDIAATATAAKTYTLQLAVDSIAVWGKDGFDVIRPITVSALLAPDRANATVRSGDLDLVFQTQAGIDTLAGRIRAAAAVIGGQVRTGTFDMETVARNLPEFGLKVSAGQENILNNWLKTKDMSFAAMDVNIVSAYPLPFRASVAVNRFRASGTVIDTLRVGLEQDKEQLDYRLRIDNAPANPLIVSMMCLDGYIAGNEAIVNLKQKDKTGRTGFDFGMHAKLQDSTLTVNLFPEGPTLGFGQWQIKKDNFISYRFGHELNADFTLTNGSQRFSLVSQAGREGGDLLIDIVGIDIGSMLSLFPQVPSVQGILGADLTVRLGARGEEEKLAVRGNLGIDSLSWQRQPVGNLALFVDYRMQAGQGQIINTYINLDSTRIVTVSGSYLTALPGKPLDLDLGLDVPLRVAAAFIPDGTIGMTGLLRGNVHAGGADGNIDLKGDIRFDDTRVDVPAIGASFGISAEPITIADNVVRFDRFGLVAPNGQRLVVDGTASLGDFSAVLLDLTVKASEFQAINVARNRNSMIYGKAYLDMGITVNGPVNNLAVRGNIGLLNGTDVTYVMQDSPLEVKNKQQDMVTFVSFSDTTSYYIRQKPKEVRISGVDLQVDVNVSNAVQLGVDLSQDGENRIQLQGGGNLTYTMNQLGDTRFTGRYEVSGGTVRYNPPIISEKIFKITQGSYVEWTGELADPYFNITAVEAVRATVTSEDGGKGRPVKFDISISVRNSLDNMEIVFDLSAPEDLTMQNQLASLTAEQRASQAMGLLIYNTYTGPGTTAKVNSSNPLDAFIERELNRWAQNNLSGIDLTFGIDTYDETATGGTQRTDYSYQLSKNIFNNRVKVVIGGKFSTDTDPTQNLKENLIDDIAVEYMITKRDNMFFRVFRHTGYESILEGEVTETGVGFVIRKKLLKLGDLFRFAKSRVPATVKTVPAQRDEKE